MRKKDSVNHPAHYNKGKFEVIDIIQNYVVDAPNGFYGYCFGNVIKYALRHLYKNKPGEDLKKAIWYINQMIKNNILSKKKGKKLKRLLKRRTK